MKKTLGFAAGMLAVITAVLGAVLFAALDEGRFEQAVLAHVNGEAVGMDAAALSAFARHTISYLSGRLDAWQPDVPFAIPESFVLHMAEVRLWVDALRWLLPLGAVLSALGLWGSRRTMLTGMFGMLGLLLLLLAWAAVDFDSLWMVLHRLLIPGGIFPAGEPVMQLFPLALFFSYIVPVLLWLLAGLGLWLAVVWLFPRFSKG